MRIGKLLLIVISMIYLAFSFHPMFAKDFYTIQENFSKYTEESDGALAWDTTSTGWKITQGLFESTDTNKSFAFISQAPYCKVQTIESTLILRDKTLISWKTAGLVVYQEDGFYWQLALVEKPDSDGKARFVEIVEMYNNNWHAENDSATKLSLILSKGANFNWEYNVPYKLRLELTSNGITGFVFGAEGIEHSKISYKFDKPAVTFGKPGLVNAGFKAQFDNIYVKLEMREIVKYHRKQNFYPPYVSKGWTGIKGKKTGFFHVEEIKGKWWTIDPTGNAYYIIGVDHANYNVHWCEKLGYAPYHQNVKAKYGSESRWALNTQSRLLNWGFNSLGVNSSPSLRYKGLAHMNILNMGTNFNDFIIPKTTWTGFPNVFNEKFQIYCDKTAKRLCAPQKEDPWLIGYFIDNELEWYPKNSNDIFNSVFEMNEGNSAKKALVDFFKTRYNNKVSIFNKVWGTNICSFDDLLKYTESPEITTPPAMNDKRDFIRLVAERYFKIITSAIRKYDPNHMVLGCRFAEDKSIDIWDIAGKYCDIVSINRYRQVDVTKGILVDGFENELANWYKLVGRPFMISEWSFIALDAGLPCKYGAGQRFKTQKERASAFTIFQHFLFATPFLVGSNFFMWADEPKLGISSDFPEDSNYGLVNVNDDPYIELINEAATVNGQAYNIHNGKN